MEIFETQFSGIHCKRKEELMKLFLASKSPRRRQLLMQLGIPVEIVDIDVDEVVPPATSVDIVASSLALLKSKGYQKPLCDGEVLVTADTVVVHRGELLGKPHSRDEALAMLGSLSGDVHTVYTGVCLRSCRRQVVFSEHTDVFFRRLDKSILEHYVDMGTCMDKAGAYGIQEWIGMVGVERIEGCYYNVMGLPLSRLYSELTSAEW